MAEGTLEFPTTGTIAERRREWLCKVRRRRPKAEFRNRRVEKIARSLSALPVFSELPRRMVLNYCELENVSSQIGAYFRKVGLFSESGELSPAVDKYRLLKLAETQHLRVMCELAMQMRQSAQPSDSLLAQIRQLPQLQPEGRIQDLERAADGLVLDSDNHQPDRDDRIVELEAECNELKGQLADLKAKLRDQSEIDAEIEELRRIIDDGHEPKS